MNQPQQQSKSGCYLQRPNQPKMEGKPFLSNHKKTSLSMSIGSNQVVSNLIPQYRIATQNNQSPITSTTKGSQAYDLQLELETLSRQNVSLKQQNSQLKKELLRLRKDVCQSGRSTDKYSVSYRANNDLRGTIKKQEMKQMGLKFEMLSKQCHMHEQINEKMEYRIKSLTVENKKSRAEVEELQEELGRLDNLKEKCNSLMKLYNNLESKFNSDQLEWMKWKQGWLAQKQYYVKRIQQLQKQEKKATS